MTCRALNIAFKPSIRYITTPISFRHIIRSNSTRSIHKSTYLCRINSNTIRFLSTNSNPNPNATQTQDEDEEDDEYDDEEEYIDDIEGGQFGEVEEQRRAASRLTWRIVFGTAIMLSLGLVIYQQIIHKQGQQQGADIDATYGEAYIGAEKWKMTNHLNQKVDQSIFEGKYQLVYFGFTFCPDVCPRELTKMSNAIDILTDRGYGNDLMPVFVSVDPKRDTPALVAKYIRQFHSRIYGLTGTAEQVSTFAKAYKAYYSSPSPNESDEDYIVDHVTMMYIMNRQGQFIGHISVLDNAEEMADKIQKLMTDVAASGGFLGTLFAAPSKLIGKQLSGKPQGQ